MNDPHSRAANLWAFSLIGRGIVVAAHLDAPPVQMRVQAGKIILLPFSGANLVARFGPPILIGHTGEYQFDMSRPDRYPHGKT